MRKKAGFGTLGSRIYITFTIMIFATIFIMQLVAFRFTVTTVRNSTLETNQAMLKQLIYQIDSYILGMERISMEVLQNDILQEFLKTRTVQQNNHGEKDGEKPVQMMLQHFTQARDDISEILLFLQDGSVIASTPDIAINPWLVPAEQHWYIAAVEAGSQIAVSSSYVQNLIQGSYSWVVSLSRSIMSEDGSTVLGVLLVDLKFNRIQELCQSMVIGEKGYNFIIDDDENYVFHPTQQLVYSDIKSEPLEKITALLMDTSNSILSDGLRYYMANTSPYTGWHIVSVLSSEDIVTDWRNVQLSYAAIGLILFLIVGVATNSVSVSITKPISTLQKTMKSVENGVFNPVGPIRATDEVRSLAKEYDIIILKIRELMDEIVREQELKRKSDLKALQAQINPHFLYNTLDSIIWMGEMKQSREVVNMTSALSKLFRISISKGKELISIKDEIEHVQSYLTIEEMRYRNKFDYMIDVDPSIYEHSILKITLQPLVENAIYHGIKEVDCKGYITITGEKEGDDIHFTVTDNGKGLEKDRLEALNRSLENPFLEEGDLSHKKMGMGILNVHARLKLYFGEPYGLSCQSSEGSGTTIHIRFPVQKGEQAS